MNVHKNIKNPVLTLSIKFHVQNVQNVYAKCLNLNERTNFRAIKIFRPSSCSFVVDHSSTICRKPSGKHTPETLCVLIDERISRALFHHTRRRLPMARARPSITRRFRRMPAGKRVHGPGGGKERNTAERNQRS